MADDSAFDFDSVYVHLKDNLDARHLPVDENFWANIEERSDLDEGRLVMLLRFTEDWPTWEIHPEGDEIVYQLSGAMDFLLENEAGEVSTVELRGRSAVIVPRGQWHRALVREPSEALFVTPGKGTRNRPA